MVREFGMDMYTLPLFRMHDHQGPTRQHRELC